MTSKECSAPSDIWFQAQGWGMNSGRTAVLRWVASQPVLWFTFKANQLQCYALHQYFLNQGSYDHSVGHLWYSINRGCTAPKWESTVKTGESQNVNKLQWITVRNSAQNFPENFFFSNLCIELGWRFHTTHLEYCNKLLGIQIQLWEWK